MAKRIIKWTLVEPMMKLWAAEDDIESAEPKDVFNLVSIYSDFTTMTEVQKQIICYGVRQKLADVGSAEKTAAGKVESASKMWTQLLEGKWTGERVNATGNAENKVIASRIKEASKVVSFDGLMAKKLGTPDQFTEEDQIKLDEFIARMAQEQEAPKKGKK